MKRAIKLQLRNSKFYIRRKIFKVYAHIKHPLSMWRLFNIKSVRLYEANKPNLNDIQNRILKDLKNDGIAITSLEELFPGKNLLSELQGFIDKKEERSRVNHKKKFLVDYLPEAPDIDFQVPFLSLALDKKIVDVVNSYMGMYSIMTYFMIQKTLESDLTKGHGLRHSQNWHRDPQELRFCKVFIYLNDIDEKKGPFIYIPNSKHGSRWGNLFPQKVPSGSYPASEQLEEAIPPENWKINTGKAGTVIFADTNGLHKGGLVVEGKRLMSTFGYSAPTYRENLHYSFKDTLLDEIKDLPPQSQFVLNRKWMRKTHNSSN